MVTQSRNSYVEADLHAPTMEELFKSLEEDDGTYQTHMELRLQGLLKEARDKAKGWLSCSSTDNTELHYKKVGLGPGGCWVEIPRQWWRKRSEGWGRKDRREREGRSEGWGRIGGRGLRERMTGKMVVVTGCWSDKDAVYCYHYFLPPTPKCPPMLVKLCLCGTRNDRQTHNFQIYDTL